MMDKISIGMMLLLSAAVATASGVRVPLLMPSVQPTVDDTYLCYSIPVYGSPKYITKYTPEATGMIAHHMLLFGCGEPGSGSGRGEEEKEGATWNCGEMLSADANIETKPVCGGGGAQKTIYAWAMDAPGLAMPAGIAFKVGANSGINHIVLQVHYKNTTMFRAPHRKRDSSGVVLEMQSEATPRLAGIYVLGTDGSIAPRAARVSMDTACPYVSTTFARLHPFKYRVHTHKHGRVVSGYVVKRGGDGEETAEIDSKIETETSQNRNRNQRRRHRRAVGTATNNADDNEQYRNRNQQREASDMTDTESSRNRNQKATKIETETSDHRGDFNNQNRAAEIEEGETYDGDNVSDNSGPNRNQYRNHRDAFHEIGHQSPQLPQMFYDVSEPGLEVHYGDWLAARCVMENNGTKAVPIGATQADEMCNFYVMFWVWAWDEAVLSDPDVQACFSAGPPQYSWLDDFAAADIPPRSMQEVKSAAENAKKKPQGMKM